MPLPERCPRWEHACSRRKMLGMLGGAVGVGMGGLCGAMPPAVADELRANERQVLLVWLDGGMSQLESWDPKPGTLFGGPFRSIPSRLPGVHLSELMPQLAQRMDRFSLVRNMQTEDKNHSSGVPKILRGHPKDRGVTYPYMGSAISNLLGATASGLPPYVWIKPGSGGFISQHAGFLGAKYGALAVGDGRPPDNLVPPEELTPEDNAARQDLRRRLNARFAQGRRPAATEAHAQVFDVAEKLVEHAELFDESRLPEADRQRYGTHDLGRHMLLARRLLEAGVRFVQVTSYGWDTHGDNFNAHASRVPKVDQSLAAILDDLASSGLDEHVLVIVMAEFGRTPRVNGAVGRDHWPNAWSLATAGCGIRPGVVVGGTTDDGTDVAETPHDIGALFHTWYQALGIDSLSAEYHNGAQPLPIAHDDMRPVADLLA